MTYIVDLVQFRCYTALAKRVFVIFTPVLNTLDA